jgi:hypothetical protein
MHRFIIVSLLAINLLLIYVHSQDIGGEGGSGSAQINIGANTMSRVTGVCIFIDKSNLNIIIIT